MLCLDFLDYFDFEAKPGSWDEIPMLYEEWILSFLEN